MADTTVEADPAISYRFDKLLNFRDVGAHINTITGRTVLRTGLLFRSARPEVASQSDRDQLVNKYRVKTIIDLRSKTEHINAAKKRSAVDSSVNSAALPSSDKTFDDEVRQPVEIPGIRYTYINLNGKGFERHLIWQLKYTSLAKLVFLMALGYRTQGISVLGKELMLPRGLIGLGTDTLDCSGPEIKEVFDVLADSTAWPVMVNCTQGKDRTGITTLLLLLLCGVDLNAITQDYVKSEEELEPEKAERMREIESIGLDESFATCPPDFCEKVVQHLESKYGGIGTYLSKIGVDANQAERVRHILKANG
jgi:protein tyrosine/serine phosphatase